MATQAFIGTLEVVTCGQCGMAYGMEQSFRQQKLNDGTTFYCPNGHARCYGKSRVQELEEQVAEKERMRKWEAESKERAWKQNSTLTNRLRAQRGVTTRIKNRVANGVCPGCQRSFQNLKNHMKTKHPEWNHAHEQGVEPNA